MDIADFDGLSPERATALLTECAAIPRWVAAVVARRPFGSTDRLLEFARDAASSWTPVEVDAALADHPRIGRSPTGGAGANHSRREQASISGGDADTAERIRLGNIAYEERFGRIFLIRAAGRSAHDILEQLELRMRNEPDAELRVFASELRDIALLRLERSVE